MQKPKQQKQDAPTRLTDDECDVIIRKVLQSIATTVNPIAFFREVGRGVVFEVADADRERVRGLVRLIARGE